jgi:cell wall-associated NlpC family hydrolase
MINETMVCDKYLKTHIPFKHLGRSVKGLDCYGLIKCIYADAGIELIDVEDYAVGWSKNGQNFFLDNYYRQFEEAITPHFLDVVLFKNGQGIANHAGVVLSGNRFIHCSKAGVNIQKLVNWFPKLVGFYRIKR